MNLHRKNIPGLIILIVYALSYLNSCHGGSLEFTANGEEFVKNGLISRDGWHIHFNRLIINISNPTAYNPAGTPLPVTLEGAFTVDLTLSPPGTTLVSLGILPDVPPGNYQSLSFTISRMEKGEFAGHSIILEGTADKEEKRVLFLIKLDEEVKFNGKDGYVGDTVKGIVKEGQDEEVEMTFHIDHIFGNAEAPGNSHVNTESPGFGIFLDYADNGEIIISQNELRDHPLYNRLLSSLTNLGHLGEGHCEVEEL